MPRASKRPEVAISIVDCYVGESRLNCAAWRGGEEGEENQGKTHAKGDHGEKEGELSQAVSPADLAVKNISLALATRICWVNRGRLPIFVSSVSLTLPSLVELCYQFKGITLFHSAVPTLGSRGKIVEYPSMGSRGCGMLRRMEAVPVVIRAGGGKEQPDERF